MPKIDLRKQLKHLYQPSAKEVSIVDVPPMNFVMIDGVGAPESPACQDAMQALYGISFTLKFGVKLGKYGRKKYDYPVMALEGLWWVNADRFSWDVPRDQWRWTLMIMQPDIITSDLVEAARADAIKKKPSGALSQVRFESFHEGLCAQIMHLGPYSAERPTVDRLHQFIVDSGHQLIGKHHEIYLGDPRRAKPEKLKTVLRQPMK